MIVKTQKQEGQFMTPKELASMVLDFVGYKGDCILSKKIMEPSFGDGVFLKEITRRLIKEGRQQGLSDDILLETMEANIYGIEKDTQLYHEAIEGLNALLIESGLSPCGWKNLKNTDTLLAHKNYRDKFDYVVGNPPFVRIHNLSEEYNKIIRDFRFSKGMFDLYVLFYEMGIYMLNSRGKLGFISPSSFMRNVSQRDFRKFLLDHKLLSAIYNFEDSKLFGNADTYTCICILDKNKERCSFDIEYKKLKMYEIQTTEKFDYLSFIEKFYNKPWDVAKEDELKFLRENQELSRKLGDIAIVQNGIVTNRDNLYIKKLYIDQGMAKPYKSTCSDETNFVYFDDNGKSVKIEAAIMRRCIKESRFEGDIDNTYILFPYYEKPVNNINDKTYEPYTELEIKEKFPFAYKYLCSIRSELEARDMDSNTDWFLFGRSQGLQNSFRKKLIFKHVVDRSKKSIVPYIIDEDIIVYSKIYTTIDPKICIIDGVFNKDEESRRLKEVFEIFSSYDFWKYCTLTGKPLAGGYLDISTRIIKNFGIKGS